MAKLPAWVEAVAPRLQCSQCQSDSTAWISSRMKTQANGPQRRIRRWSCNRGHDESQVRFRGTITRNDPRHDPSAPECLHSGKFTGGYRPGTWVTLQTRHMGDTLGHSEVPMPWKETCVMDERLGLVAAVHEKKETIAALCRRFGTSRNKGYKLPERYSTDGPGALLDQSRARVTH